jgi:hypothetical protein
MAEKVKFDLKLILCIAVGIIVSMVLVRVTLGWDGILGGALGGGLGAALGIGLHSLLGFRK